MELSSGGSLLPKRKKAPLPKKSKSVSSKSRASAALTQLAPTRTGGMFNPKAKLDTSRIFDMNDVIKPTVFDLSKNALDASYSGFAYPFSKILPIPESGQSRLNTNYLETSAQLKEVLDYLSKANKVYDIFTD